MSRTVDERVVEMRFDNKQFEAGVQTSLSTLAKLKKSLDLDGAAKGFDELSSAAKKCDMSTLSSSVENVSKKFSALETIAVGALLRIGSQVADTGTRLVKSLSVDQVAAGWDKYAEKTASVQTIMNATGKSIDEVNGYLDKLMWFSDETSYGFTDMTGALAQMTSSGGDIDKLIPMITGVANATAYAGKGAAEFSRIMYNLNQSYGAGSLQLMDWKSVELAGAGSKELKQILIDTAKEVGTLNKLGKTAKGNLVDIGTFNSTLADKWATTEVMEKAFGKFSELSEEAYRLVEAGEYDTASEAIAALSGQYSELAEKAFKSAQEAKTFTEAIDATKDAVSSGWMETFEIIFGNYEQAKVLWTDLANGLWDVFASGAEKRNEMLKEALGTSGFDGFKSGLKDAGVEMSVFNAKLEEIASGKEISLNSLISEYGSLEAAVQNGAISMDLLKEAALSSAETLKETEGFDETAYQGFVESIDGLVAGADKLSGRQHLIEAFWNTWDGVGAVLSTVSEAFRDIFPETTADQIYSFVQGLNEATARFKAFITESEEGKKILGDLKNTFKGVFAVADIVRQIFTSLWRAIAPLRAETGGLLSGVLGLTGSLGEWITNLSKLTKENDVFYKVFKTVVDVIVSAIDVVKRFLGIANTNIAAPGLEFLQTVFETLSRRATQVLDAIDSMANGITGAFDKIDTSVTQNKFVLVLTSIWELAKKVAHVVSNLLGKAFDGLINTLKNADFSTVMDFLNAIATGGLIVAIKKFFDVGNGLSDFVGSFKDFADKFGAGIIDILDSVRGCFEAYQQNLKASTLLKIAGAIAILAAALVVLSGIDPEKLANALVNITALFAELMATMAIFNKIAGSGTKQLSKTGTAMIKLSVSVLILANAMKILADLSWEGIGKGLSGIAGCVVILAALFKTMQSNQKTFVKGSGSLLIASSALTVLAAAMRIMAGMSLGGLGKALAGLSGCVIAMVILFKTMESNQKVFVKGSGSLLIASAALTVLASDLRIIAEMSWGDLARSLVGLSALVLAMVVVFKTMESNQKVFVKGSGSMLVASVALTVLAADLRIIGSMSWDGIIKGLVGIAGLVTAMVVVFKTMESNQKVFVKGSGSMLVASLALAVLTTNMKKIGGMSWEGIAKGLIGLAGSMTILAVGLKAMKGTEGGSASLLVAAAALLVLTPALKALGGMTWEEIAKGLITIAGAFAIIGVAGFALAELTPVILALSAAMALFGAGVVLLSAGIAALGVALGAGATAIAAGLGVIITEIANLIPYIAQKLAEAIVAICEVITKGAPAIAEAVIAVVLAVVELLVQCVPAIADGALAMVVGVLDALVAYTPQIVDALFQFLIGILEGIARNLPNLIQAVVDVIMSLFSGVVDALANVDIDVLVKGIAGIGLLAGVMAALAAVAAMTPAAMLGVLGMGAVLAELAIVLAGIGALSQIPGLDWLINEGAALLQSIGNAIGGFVGGIVGGFMGGVTGQFPQIGTDLSAFMTNVQPFVDGASKISPDMLNGVKALTEVLLLLTAAEIIDSLTSWFTGGSSLGDFAADLIPFGEAMAQFAKTVAGIDGEVVSQAAIAGKTMAEMAATLPNSGGVVGFFTGENDMDVFGQQLVVFGESIANFSETVKGVDPNVVTAAATAGKAMAEMASTIPNSGGVVDFFAGNNDLDQFGAKLVPFGEAMKLYSDSVKGLDADVVTNSVLAGQALIDLAQTVPNCGGLTAFFAGDNTLDVFGSQIVPFGAAMKAYSDSVVGINPEAVVASATAGQALVNLAQTIPNCGGLVSFFTGDNTLDVFGAQIVIFGQSMKDYSDAVTGFNAAAVIASATAGQTLAKLQSSLPNIGGVVGFFAGNKQSLGSFAEGVIPFGEAMKLYSDAVTGLDAGAVEASATAGQALANLQSSLPNVGGVIEFFTGGQQSLGAFAEGIVPFGEAMRKYAESVGDIQNVGSVEASATIAQSLANLQSSLPNVGGVMEFFTGKKQSLDDFAQGITPFGIAMKSYADAVGDIDNVDAVLASSTIANSLAELQTSLPNVGGVMEFFTGKKQSLADFGANITPFGAAMASYAAAVGDIQNTAAVEASATVAESLAALQTSLPNVGGVVGFFTGDPQSLASFSEGIEPFGLAMRKYADAVGGMENIEAVKASGVIAESLAALQESLPNVGGVVGFFSGNKQSLGDFAEGIAPFGTAMANYAAAVGDMKNVSSVEASAKVADALVNLGSKDVDAANLKSVGDSLASFSASFLTGYNSLVQITPSKIDSVVKSADSFITMAQKTNTLSPDGISNFATGFCTSLKTIMESSVTDLTNFKSKFTQVGKDVGQGFINGISSKLSSATTAGRKLGEAALTAARKALDSHSPSREFIHLGENIGDGLAIGMQNSIVPVSEASSTMTEAVLSASSQGIDAWKNWAENKKYYGELSLKDELAGWEQIQQMYAEGSEERIQADKEVFRVQNELVSSTYQASLDWIEQEKFYNRLSKEEELAAYERMQTRYLEGSKERIELDKKIYTLRGELADQAAADEKQAIDDAYQYSMDWIEQEKYYGRMTLSDELAAYKRVQSRYAKGTEERKKMDREVYRLEKEIYEAQQQYMSDVQAAQESYYEKRADLEQQYADKVKSINEQLESDIKSLNDSYTDAVKSRTDALYQAYGLFDEVAEKEAVSGDTLMKNLEDQVKEFGEWQDVLNGLSARGMDSELVEELQDMGPAAISQIKALNSMSDDELDKYTSLWKLKHTQARHQATSELEGLRIETQEQIAQLREDADKELDEYRVTWNEQMNQLDVELNDQLEALRQDFAKKVGLIKTDTEKTMSEMSSTAQTILKNAGWNETGQQIVTGLSSGVSEQSQGFLAQITQLALDAAKAAREALDEHSPSRVFRKIGNYAGMGLVVGLNEYADKSYEAASNVGKEASDGLSTAVERIREAMTNGFDDDLTIRPVLDLSDVARGARELSGMLPTGRAIGLAASAAYSIGDSGGTKQISVNNADVVRELQQLRGEMSTLSERVGHLQVVMDTGALVGEITDPIDTALGQKSTFKGRGI